MRRQPTDQQRELVSPVSEEVFIITYHPNWRRIGVLKRVIPIEDVFLGRLPDGITLVGSDENLCHLCFLGALAIQT